MSAGLVDVRNELEELREVEHDVGEGNHDVLVDKLENVEDTIVVRARIVHIDDVASLEQEEAEDLVEVVGAV